MKKILVAVDGSDHSMAAVDLAADIARKYDAELLMLHVVRRGRAMDEALKYGPTDHIGPEAVGIIERISKEVLDKAVARVESSGGPKARTMSHEGNVARQIIDMANKEKVDLIVLGSRGREGLPGLLLGSVSQKVVSVAPCPTLVV